MANVYSKVYLHTIFAVKYRQALLDQKWRQDLFSYMSGIINNRGNYSLAVNGYYDHVHLFFDYKGRELISDLVRELKKASNDYIKDHRLTRSKFHWQSGYAVFSHGYKEKKTVIKYIMDQEDHHKKRPFKQEYLQFLNEFEIEFKNEYLFDFLE
ncbi:MAG TPA: IS200/IS605 family transposase [Membranihabitans sp.]|nr:IS200/IS605 family transposase [Membranihabitans sp.]